MTWDDLPPGTMYEPWIKKDNKDICILWDKKVMHKRTGGAMHGVGKLTSENLEKLSFFPKEFLE